MLSIVCLNVCLLNPNHCVSWSGQLKNQGSRWLPEMPNKRSVAFDSISAISCETNGKYFEQLLYLRINIVMIFLQIFELLWSSVLGFHEQQAVIHVKSPLEWTAVLFPSQLSSNISKCQWKRDATECTLLLLLLAWLHAGYSPSLKVLLLVIRFVMQHLKSCLVHVVIESIYTL